MTTIEIPPAAKAARDAAWTVGQDVEELREAYAEVALALDRVWATTRGSPHPLPARVLRSWSAGLALLDQVEADLLDGTAALGEVPDVRPLGTAGELIASWSMASSGVHRVTGTLTRMRERISAAAAHLTEAGATSADTDTDIGASGNSSGCGNSSGHGGDDANTPHPAVRAAQVRWRASLGVLDLLVARLQHGVAALNAYSDGVVGIEPRPSRRQRLAAVLPLLRHPPEHVAAGAELALRLVRAARRRAHPAPVPAHLRVPRRRELAWALRRPPLPVPVRRLVSPWPEGPLAADCLRAVEHLVQGNTRWYADRVGLLRDARVIDGYAVALAAGLVVAAERRFPDREPSQVRRVARRLVERYDPAGREIDVVFAETALWAALGDRTAVAGPDEGGCPLPDGPGRAGGPVSLGAVATLLLVDLLADERLTGREWTAFHADVVALAESVDPVDADADADGDGDGDVDGAGDGADGADAARDGRRGPADR